MEAGVSLDDFLDDFPTVTRDQAVAMLNSYTSHKESILNNVKSGLEEVRLYKQGKLETTSARDFLDQL